MYRVGSEGPPRLRPPASTSARRLHGQGGGGGESGRWRSRQAARPHGTVLGKRGGRCPRRGGGAVSRLPLSPRRMTASGHGRAPRWSSLAPGEIEDTAYEFHLPHPVAAAVSRAGAKKNRYQRFARRGGVWRVRCWLTPGGGGNRADWVPAHRVSGGRGGGELRESLEPYRSPLTCSTFPGAASTEFRGAHRPPQSGVVTSAATMPVPGQRKRGDPCSWSVRPSQLRLPTL